MKVSVITLGCDKNTVDSERYVAQLADHGATYTSDLDDADVVLVNTCGFIDAAKKESIDAMVEAGRLKDRGSCKAVVGVGCMVERHKDELLSALPEIDLFLGSSEMDRLVPELTERGLLAADDVPVPHPGVRQFVAGLPHVRYLKVSEGCDHGCAFCAIPLMRGKHRSFALDDIVREAQLLEAQGAREVNLVAQDLAHYGRDVRDRKVGLADVLTALVRETSIPWIRMLYIYSAGLTPAVLELMATESRIVPYLDMPIQHGADGVLARMRRPERQRTVRARVDAVRATVPDVAIRTTCIVGFPGETEEEYATLLEFLEELQFDRVGAFAYSAQEGTRAAEMEDDVPEAVKLERLERLNETQRLITSERYEQRLGCTVRAIVDRVDDDGVQARVLWQADDIDGVTRLAGANKVAPGSFVDVELDGVVDDVDFSARLVSVVSAPPAKARRVRALPMLGSVGSYGR
ncbi:MAG TPA: 30S ribosomal protein S12 methylthiotransferase RimO [Gemmatimonadaceae bacterium]|jgi:ribosomal protein S12 methylthiotransferase|nr:30S ribosomal protein S12 methylthiotransferase RimO [Gemmatimonadaceae bacterium]